MNSAYLDFIFHENIIVSRRLNTLGLDQDAYELVRLRTVSFHQHWETRLVTVRIVRLVLYLKCFYQDAFVVVKLAVLVAKLKA